MVTIMISKSDATVHGMTLYGRLVRLN
jgi:hypothetical protein